MKANIAKGFSHFLFFAGIGIFFFFDGFRKWRRKRLIENIPTSKIRSMAMGLVELQGKAEPRVTLLKGPLTNQDCVFYKYTVERYERHGKNSRWVTVDKETTYQNPFYLDDKTGKVLLDPLGVEIHFENPDFEYESHLMGGAIPANLEYYLTNHHIRYQGFFGNQRMRFREWLICPGDEIYVLGTVKKNESFISDLKLRLNEELRKVKGNSAEMKKLDTNNDGIVSTIEWEATVNDVGRKLMENELQQSNNQPKTDLIIGKGNEETIFILSEKSEKELIQSLFWRSIGEIVVGAIIAIFCLYFLIIK